MNFSKKQEISKPIINQLITGLLLVISPWILLFVTTNIIAHHSVFESVPCWSDELAYWHEILSFSQKGFNFGYYTINEVLPSHLSFGSHGFGAISIYALFGKIFGWEAYSIVIINTFLMSTAFLFFILITKIKSKKILYILLFSLTYSPLILFSSTSMTELLNYSVLIIYFGMLYAYFGREGKNLLILLIFFCTALSFIRIIYIVLFLPLFFKRKNEFKFDYKFLIYLVIWLFLSVGLFFLNNLFVSPYPESFLNELLVRKNFSDFIGNFSVHLLQNTCNFFNPVSENIIQVLERYFFIFVCLISLIKSNLIQTRFKMIKIEYFVVFLILFLFLLINIAAYDVSDWRDFRVMSPVLFGCVLFLTLNNSIPIGCSSLIINFIGVFFLIISPQVVLSFNHGRYEKSFANCILNRIEYNKNAVSRFENTIIVQQFNKNTVMNIPSGIGISYSEVLSDKLKSKYLFSEKKIVLTTYKLIDSNESGYLYKKKNNIILKTNYDDPF